MDAAIQSFLAGIPFLLSHFGVTVLMLVIGVFIYMWICLLYTSDAADE